MSLRALLQSAVHTAIEAIGDLSTLITYIDKSDEVYDPATGVLTANDVTYENVLSAVVSFQDDEVDGAIVEKTDRKVIFSSLDLTITPRNQDIIMIDGIEWNIRRILSPVSNVMHVLHIRET